MVDAVLTACGVLACEAAGISGELCHALVWDTPPRGEDVRIGAWKTAREVYAAQLHAHGWDMGAICAALGVSERWVRTSYQQHADMFESPAELPMLDN